MFKIKKIPDDGKFAIFRDDRLIKGGTMTELKTFLSDTESKPIEYRNRFYCLPSCTECCQQLVGLTDVEIFRIRRHLRKLDPQRVETLKTQSRDENTCPLLDMENGSCSVYEVRPDLCRDFGHFCGALACSYNLDAEMGSIEKHFASMVQSRDLSVGKLGVDYTWEKGLIR